MASRLVDDSVADPESGAFFYPWIQDPVWVKNKYPDPG